MASDFYVPIALVEALGWATICRYQFEYAINIFVAVLGAQPGNLRTCDLAQPLEKKLEYLASVPRSRLLKHDWWRRLRSIAVRADKLNEEYLSAAFGPLYSRGSGHLEEIMRPLAARAKLPLVSPGMTPLKVRDVADRFRVLTREACDLAAVLVSAAEKMSSNRRSFRTATAPGMNFCHLFFHFRDFKTLLTTALNASLTVSKVQPCQSA